VPEERRLRFMWPLLLILMVMIIVARSTDTFFA
jgi:hypothetical protein